MPGSLKLKVCGMTDAENLRQVSELRPEMLGLVFVEGSPRRVARGDEALADAVRSLPGTITTVGVFCQESPERISGVVRRFGLRAVQLHGGESGEDAEAIRALLPDISIIRAVSVKGEGDIAVLSALPNPGDLYLLDSGRGGSGEPFCWEWLRSYTAPTGFLLAGGLGPRNVAEARRCVAACRWCVGFDINSRVERQPGIKDVESVRDFKRGMSQ